MLSVKQKGIVRRLAYIGAVISVVLWVVAFAVGYGTPPYSYGALTLFLGVCATISSALTFRFGQMLFKTIMKEYK